MEERESKIEYRVLQDGKNFFIPQYKKKKLIGWGEWENCYERKYDGRDGEWYDSRITFNSLEDASVFVEKELERQTIIIHTKKSWFR